MSKISVYIVEDEALYANQLEMIVDELNYDLIGVSDNSDVAKEEIIIKKPDLVLMDVKINGSMNGIDLADEIDHNPIIIFITSFSDDATFNRAKAIKPHAYITKPFDALTLQRSIELALNNVKTSEGSDEDIVFENTLFVKNRNRLEKINVENINYLEVEDRYSTIHTDSGKKYVLRLSMGDVQDKLSPNIFFRIHRKYTINLQKVSSIDTQDNLIYLDDVPLPISRSNKEELLNKLDWLQ